MSRRDTTIAAIAGTLAAATIGCGWLLLHGLYQVAQGLAWLLTITF